jgi:S-DNA-T family DNA segregation ATPase FtsK/SpoIIIE
MPLTGIWIDEVQRYLEHEKHGATIVNLLTDLVKVGPSVGIMAVLATQKPDGQVIPDKLRGQIGSRFAMKVMTWQASETILGAGSYTAGMDASTLLRSHKGVGILLGADDGELAERGGQTVRSHLLDGPGVEAICRRGRALRDAEGLLTGMAAGDLPAESRPSRVLDDLARVFEDDPKIHSEVAVMRLAELDPGIYDGWTTNQLAAVLMPFGVKPGQTWAAGLDGKKTNRQGYARDDVVEALARRLDQ